MSTYLSDPSVGITPEQAKGIAGLAIDFSPFGDAKALLYDLPKAIYERKPVEAGLAAMAMIPAVPNLGKLKKDDLFAYPPANKERLKEAQTLVQNTRAEELENYSGDYAEEVLDNVLAKRNKTTTQYLDADAARAESGYETLPEIQQRLNITEPSLYNDPRLVHATSEFFPSFDMDKVGLGPHLGTMEQGVARSANVPKYNPTLAIDPITGMPTVRAEQAGTIIPEYVMRTGNVLEMTDVGSHHNPFAVLSDLQNNPSLTIHERSMFRNQYNDLLEKYLQKVQDMRLGLRQSEAGLYVPDRLSSSLDLPTYSPADLGSGKMDYFNVPPESILSDTFVNKNVAQGSEKFTQSAIDDLLGYKEQFGADMPEQFTEELFNVTRGLADDAAYPLREDYMTTGRKIFTEGQRAAQKVNQEQLSNINQALQKLGFNTIQYRNVGEYAPALGSQQSFISLNPAADLKFFDARYFRPDVDDLRFAKGGMVNGY